MSWQQRLKQGLAQRRADDGWRQRRIIDQQATRTLESGGRRYLHFSSNDYLGLTRHPAVIAGWQQGAAQAGAGAGASGHVTGYHRQHADLEAQLADWLGYNRALLFISGFAANQAVIHLLGEKNLASWPINSAMPRCSTPPATARRSCGVSVITTRRAWQHGSCHPARGRRWW